MFGLKRDISNQRRITVSYKPGKRISRVQYVTNFFKFPETSSVTEFGQLFLGLYDDSLDLCLCAVSHTHFPEMARKRVRSLFAHRAEKKHPAVEGSVWTIKQNVLESRQRATYAFHTQHFRFLKTVKKQKLC